MCSSDLKGATLMGSNQESDKRQSAFHIRSAEDDDAAPVSQVTIKNCNIIGYGRSIEVGLDASGTTACYLKVLGQEPREELAPGADCSFELATAKDEPKARARAFKTHEDYRRTRAPHHVTIDSVTIVRPYDSGLYVHAYAHHVKFTRGKISRTRKGPGVYLDAGSRDRKSVV